MNCHSKHDNMTQQKKLKIPYEQKMADLAKRRDSLTETVEAVEREYLATHNDLAKIYHGIEILAEFGSKIIDNLDRIPPDQKTRRREEAFKLIRAHTSCHALILKLKVTDSELHAMKRTCTVLASRAIEAEAREVEYRKRAEEAEASLQQIIDKQANT